MSLRAHTRVPDPEELLARYGHSGARRRQGRLKVFLGAAPGVGKTYAMLQAARIKHRQGLDVAVGLIETHGRPETGALVDGLEVLPLRRVEYRETALTELDLDAALARRPQLLLVDELAHTNTPGSRHAKRFQDVLELLDVGIDVWTTLNIQHLESLRDVVGKITGVVVRETLPDKVLERADEIELVDLEPNDLRRRLEEGKVYAPNVARKALDHFFRTGNLIALRELALRAAAEHVGAAMETYRKDHALTEPWSASDRLLVCVGPSVDSGRIVRLASRIAKQLRADWYAVHVERPRRRRGAPVGGDRALEHLRLAEHLGAQTRVLQGRRVAPALLDFARDRNVTTVLLGRPRPRPRLGSARRHLLEALVANQDDIQVYVVTGEAKAAEARRATRPLPTPPTDWRDYGVSCLAVGAATIVAALVRNYVALADLAMLLLLVVMLLSYFMSRGPSLFAALLSVVALDFFFVPPFYTFAVTHAEYLLTFAVMAGVGLAASTIAARIKEQAIAAQSREQLTAALYELMRSLAGCDSREELVASAVRQIWETFGTDVFLGLLGPDGRLVRKASMGRNLDEPAEQVTAQWSADHGKPAGAGTETLPGVEGFYLPLTGLEEPLGVVGVRPRSREQFDDPEQRHLLETFVSQTALALGRATLTHQAREARVVAEMERMRSSLLSSVSHDLRTPLGSIMGAASVLRDPELRLAPERREELLRAIHEEAARLERLLQNLLEMTRISGGAVQVHKEWHVPEEVIGSALARLSGELARRPVKVEMAPDIGLAPFDALLIELVLLNLIENAVKYTPEGCPIAIRAATDNESLIFEVIDDGPGLGQGDEQRVFEKFYRADGPGRPGAGLGLTICKALVEAHGGTIEAANRAYGQGAVFRVWLPRVGTPPPPPNELDDPGEPAAPDELEVTQRYR
jgi:two-component system sensor histidine kinase KdpD